MFVRCIPIKKLLLFIILNKTFPSVNSFNVLNRQQYPSSNKCHYSFPLFAINNINALSEIKLSSLPKGISPFEKSLSKTIDIQGDFRNRAKDALEKAVLSMSSAPTKRLLEIEFPPLIGGDQSKSNFDDFDNVQELDKNKEWAMQFVPLLFPKVDTKDKYGNGKIWLTFPDLKECELARKEWTGARYQKAATFTTIEAVTEFLAGKEFYEAPWGASIANGVNKVFGGSDADAGLLGDVSSLDTLEQGRNAPPELNIIVQPGNGGPVEDWINCEQIHLASPNTTMVIINGALDKVRNFYYPAFFFPKLAKTVDRFYSNFESIFYLKPISDKGVYGWMYRVFPEPWQVILQTVKTDKNGQTFIEDTIVHTSDLRPTYNDAIQKLVQRSQQI